eukprot:11180491-Lingulodinium_polyedra.AAC.1
MANAARSQPHDRRLARAAASDGCWRPPACGPNRFPRQRPAGGGATAGRRGQPQRGKLGVDTDAGAKN